MRTLPFIAFVAAIASGCAPSDDDSIDTAEGATVSGDEPVDPSGAALASCASPLMRAIYERARPVIANGSVPGRVFATSNNAPDPDAFVSGPEIFPAIADLVATAEREVDMQFYVWETESQVSAQVLAGLGRLAEKRRAAGGPPVVVRILLDVSAIGFGSSLRTLPRLHRAIARLGIEERHVEVHLGLFIHTVLGNLHTKSVVVDGSRGIVTGANVQKHHDEGAPWYDAGFRVDGEAAQSLLADFDYHWGHRNTNEWTCGDREDIQDTLCRKRTQKLTRTLPLVGAPDACVPVLAVTRTGDPGLTSNRVDNPQNQAFLAAIGGAKKRIAMITPNLNDDAAKNAIVDAVVAESALRVELILSKHFNDKPQNLPAQGGDNQKNVAQLYDRLTAAGVANPCERLAIRWYSADGREAVVGNIPLAAHAKFAAFDDQVSIVGSANMDTQSWNNSHELNLAIDDAETTRAWTAKVFDPAYARSVPVERCAR